MSETDGLYIDNNSGNVYWVTITCWDYACVVDTKEAMTYPCPLGTESLEGDGDKRASSHGAGGKDSDQGPEVCTVLQALLKKCAQLQKELGRE